MTQIILGDLEKYPKLLNQFIKENTRSMIQYCVRNFENLNAEDAEELDQDAFVELFEIIRQKKVKKRDAPTIAWMKKELRWRCLDLVRKKKREGRKIASDEERKNIINILPYPISAEDEVIQRDIHQFLRECVEVKMKGRRREIFKLYLKGYIAAEIARKLGVTRAFVSKETKIGCRLLRKWLEKREIN